MINTIDHNITIDLATAVSMAPDIRIKQQDTNSHKFIFTVTDNGTAYDLTGLTARVYFTKGDGAVVFQDCTIDTPANGIMSTLLTTQCLTYPGFVNAELTLYGTDGETLTSSSFLFRVIDLDRNDTAIESTSEFTSLTNIIMAAGDLYLLNDIRGTNQTIVFNSDATISSISHKNAEGTTIRTDVFVYGINTITELRTLISSGRTLTYINHTDTSELEVI